VSLTLKVTSYQSQSLGADALKVFDKHGGTIGRASTNDWVLPDTMRILSGKHAVVSYDQGAYYLTDTSTNGVFVNEAKEPIGKGNKIRLSPGDELALGDYTILVSIDAFAVAEAIPRVIAEEPFAPSAHEEKLTPGVERGELRSSAGPEESAALYERILEKPPWPHEDLAGRAEQRAAEPDHLAGEQQYFKPPEAAVEQIPEDWSQTDSPASQEPIFSAPAVPETEPERLAPSREKTQPEGAEAQPPPLAEPKASIGPPATSARETLCEPEAIPRPTPIRGNTVTTPQPEASSAALLAFLRGAGLDLATPPAGDPDAILNELGRIFHIIVEGMMEVLAARSRLKSEFRAHMTMIGPVRNNPLKFSADADEALRHLVIEQEKGYLAPIDAFTEGFQDIKDHEMATMAGMRAAFNLVLQRFDPESLRKTFDRGPRHAGLLTLMKKARYWDLFTEFYRDLLRDAEDNFQEIFGEEFARAYEEQLGRLCALRKKNL
jgi:type VI secretion system protein